MYQIGKVITFLNYRRICHRDLKLDNIMIDEEMNPKIIDWGSVCAMHSIDNDPGALKVKDERRNFYFYSKFFPQRDIFRDTMKMCFMKLSVKIIQGNKLRRVNFLTFIALGLLSIKFST